MTLIATREQQREVTNDWRRIRLRESCEPSMLPASSKATCWTACVCPLSVRSSSAPSQSQILIVASSLLDAAVLNFGCRAMHVTGLRCPASSDWAGARGSKRVPLAVLVRVGCAGCELC